MEIFLRDAFYDKLRMKPEETAITMTDSPSTISDRPKIAEIMFESFNIPGLYILDVDGYQLTE